MYNEAALSAITEYAEMFGVEKLIRLDPSKTKSFRLSSKFAYFQGGSSFHRVAVVCPTSKALTGEQQLLAGLVWANKVSNGQKTVLYLVDERFGPQLNYILRMFGPRVEVRLAYFTPKLSLPFLIGGREPGTVPPRYQVPLPKDQAYWERKFNPVEQGWLRAALEYFKVYTPQGIDIYFLENWVSVRFKGLEIARISKKENRLRIVLIIRYPREIPGVIGNREELEGWFNAQGELNNEFKQACETRMKCLEQDWELFTRVCPDQYFMEHLVKNRLGNVEIKDPIYSQLDLSCKGDPPLNIDILARNNEGNLLVIAFNPSKDLLGFGRVLAQTVWAETQFSVIKSTYFNSYSVLDPVAWLVCPENRIHPDLEVLHSLMRTPAKIRLVLLNNDWAEVGITSINV